MHVSPALTNSVTDILTQEVPPTTVLGLLAGGALAFPVSLLLLRRYRRAVLRQMTRIGSGSPVPPAPPVSSAPGIPLGVQRFDLTTSTGGATIRDVDRRAVRDMHLAGAVQVVGGVALAVVQAITYLMATRTSFEPLRFLVLLWIYAWPGVLAYNLVAATRRAVRLGAVTGYAIGYLLLWWTVRSAGNPVSLVDMAVIWLITNAMSTVLLLAFLTRRVRAVGPLVLAFMFVVVAGSFALGGFVGTRPVVLRWIDVVDDALPLPAGWSVAALLLVVVLVSAVFGWVVLRLIGRSYEAKRFSDQGLILAALFIVFIGPEAVIRVFDGWYWVFSGVVAFAVYQAVTAMLFRRLVAARHRPARRLLLLRVFDLGPRSVRMFDVLGKLWLRQGTIAMIAGPDLATTTVEPHEFLSFLSGRLGRLFIGSPDELRSRLNDLDVGSDPDGRYRITELFCQDHVWRDAVARLAAGSDAVLMDLRGFRKRHCGCIVEIGILLDEVPLRQVVLIVDETTDQTFLVQLLQKRWLLVPPASPNRALAHPVVRLAVAGRSDACNVRALLRSALVSASPQAS